MRYRSMYIAVASIAVVVVCQAAVAEVQNNGQEIVIAVVGEHGAITLGKPVILQVTVKNMSENTLVLPLYSYSDVIHLQIQDEHGVVPLETEFGCRLHASEKCVPKVRPFTQGVKQDLVVKPGQERTISINVTDEYIISKAGIYGMAVNTTGIYFVDTPAGTDLQQTGKVNPRKVGAISSNLTQISIVPAE